MNSAWTIEWSKQARDDEEAVARFLIQSHCDFGYSLGEAIDLAEARIKRIEGDIDAMIHAPYQGLAQPHLGEAVRMVAKERAVIYFEPVEAAKALRILAVFYGGQDHGRWMTARATSRS